MGRTTRGARDARRAEMRRMIGLGVPTSVIAERMGLSVRTVEDYRAGLRAVMGLAPGSHGALDAALGRELGRQEGLDEARREAQAEVDKLKREIRALRESMVRKASAA